MLANKKVTVVLPAYNAAQTLKQTFDEIPHDIVDDIILTDDASKDDTVAMARSLGIPTIRHDRNRGYGSNQKTCYTAALARGADIVVMLHPDYQYTPKLVTAMASMIASEEFDVVLGSRILGRGALVGGMPVYKYVSNRFLTLFENIMIGQKLSEYHTGYRAWSRAVLERLPLRNNSDDSSLTTRCWFKLSISDLELARSVVRQNTFRKPHLSTFDVAWSMGSAS
jgi:glycosyltransferase involved in cell wall biosynthesis